MAFSGVQWRSVAFRVTHAPTLISNPICRAGFALSGRAKDDLSLVLCARRTAVAVYSFTQVVSAVQSFTTDRTVINAGIDWITTLGSGTSIYDAVVSATFSMANRSGARHIVLLT